MAAHEYAEEQFQYFWFAVENIAEMTKSVEKVPDQCPKCSAPLFCTACNEVPLHRPYAKQAIMALIKSVVTDAPEAAYARLSKVRHMLLHGDTKEAIEVDIEGTLAEHVDLVARVAFAAIVNALKIQGKGQPLRFLEPSEYANKTATMVVRGRIGSPPSPAIDIDDVGMPQATFEAGPIRDQATER